MAKALLHAWVAVVCVAPACAMAQSALLADDARLNARVSASHPVATIQEFLEHLSKHIGVPLKPSDEMKHDLIVLRVRDVSARDLMERVAKHFDWSWRAENNGYILYQSQEQKEREEKAYKEQYVEPLRQAQAEARRLLEQTEGKQEELRRQYDATRRLIGDPKVSPEEQSQAWWTVEMLRAQYTPFGRLAMKLLSNMTYEQLRELFTLGVLVYAITPTAAQHGMGDATPLAREAIREILTEAGADVNSGTDLLVCFRSSWGWPELERDAHITVVGAEGKEIAHESVLIPPAQRASRSVASKFLSQVSVDSPRVEELLRPLDGNPAQPEAARLSMEWYLPGTRTMPHQGHAELAVAIAEELDINLLTDLVAGSRWGDAMRSRDAGLLLDLLYPGGWQFDGDWVTARSPQWAIQRASFIPVDQVRQIRDAWYRQGGFSLDELGQFVMRYSDDQIVAWLGPYLAPHSPRTALAAARFLHSLGDPVRRIHENGAPIPALRLSPIQRSWARRIMLSDQSVWLEEYEEYGYDASRRQVVPIAMRTELMPTGVPAEAEIVLIGSQQPAVLRQRIGPDSKPAGTAYAQTISRYALMSTSPSASNPQILLRPAIQEARLVVIHLGDLRIGSAALTTTRWDPMAPFVGPDQLPQHLKDAIEQARRRLGIGGGSTS